MSDVTKLKQEFFASCPIGLEDLLLNEIKSLGVKEATISRQGVLFTAYNEIALKVLFYSRIASRVYRRVFEFDIKKEKDLYIEAKKIKWKSLFNLNQTFKITTVQGKSPNGFKRSQFKNSHFLSKLLKDSICDWFREDCDERPNVELTNPDIHFTMHIAPHDNPYATKEKVVIMVDLCGEPLSNRGYRDHAVEAPMRENLGAALIHLSGVTKDEPLYDLMTGSGTIIIEGAMIKGNIPPSYLKVREYKNNKTPWSFLNHTWFKKDEHLLKNFEELISQVEEEAKKGIESLKPNTLFASDSTKHAIKIASRNLEYCGLLDKIKLTHIPIEEATKETEKGVIIINPPYGERMLSIEEAEALYYNIGESFKKNFKDFRAYVFTGEPTLLKKISLRTSKKTILYNGNLESRFAEYLLY